MPASTASATLHALRLHRFHCIAVFPLHGFGSSMLRQTPRATPAPKPAPRVVVLPILILTCGLGGWNAPGHLVVGHREWLAFRLDAVRPSVNHIVFIVTKSTDLASRNWRPSSSRG